MRHNQVRAWAYRVALLGLAGVVAYLIGDYYLRIDSLWTHLAKDIGLAFFCSAIVALFLERLIHEALLSDVREATDSLRDCGGVLNGAMELRIRDIVARRGSVTRQRCETRIREALEHQLSSKSGEILICCVAAPEYLQSGKEVATLLFDKLALPGNACQVHVLIMCPTSKWTTMRNDLEPNRCVMPDIQTTATFLNIMRKRFGDRVEFKCYDLPPITFLIITDDLLFQEAYPLLTVEASDKIGGKTPLLIFEKESDSYLRWRGHFEFIWNPENNLSKPYMDHHRIICQPDTGATGNV